MDTFQMGKMKIQNKYVSGKKNIKNIRKSDVRASERASTYVRCHHDVNILEYN